VPAPGQDVPALGAGVCRGVEPGRFQSGSVDAAVQQELQHPLAVDTGGGGDGQDGCQVFGAGQHGGGGDGVAPVLHTGGGAHVEYRSLSVLGDVVDDI